MARSNMAWARARDCMVLVMGKDSPRDEEWDGYLEAVQGYREETTTRRHLVVTRGGAPYPEQRRASLPPGSRALDPRVRIAVITDSTYVHGVVQAQKRAMDHIEVFRSADWEKGMSFLQVPRAEVNDMLRLVNGLRAHIGLPPGVD